MKKSVMLTLLALGVSTNALWEGIALAEYDPATNTDTLTNQRVSSTRGDVKWGDLNSYDHPDRDLVIKWTNHSITDDAPILDAEVKAKNISIDTSHPDYPLWPTNVSIRSEAATHITATGDINIISGAIAVVTGYQGTTTIEGFKNLNIKVTGSGLGIGLIDNGRGITVKGGEGSTVSIDTTAAYEAISNTLSDALGEGITVEADTIMIKANRVSINAGIGNNWEPFEVYLTGRDVDLLGTIYARGGAVVVDAAADGSAKIAAPSKNGNAVTATYGGTVTLNLNGRDSSIEGNVTATNKGSAKLALSGDRATLTGSLKNAWADSSYVKPDDNASITADFSGKESGMTGNIESATSGSTITATFSGEKAQLNGNVSSRGFLYASKGAVYDGNTVNLTLSGDHASHTGDLAAQGDNTLNAAYQGSASALAGNAINSGTMHLSFANGSTMTGDITNEKIEYKDKDESLLKTVEGKLTAEFDKASIWQGNLTSTAGTAAVSLKNGSKWTGDLDAQAKDGATTVNLENAGIWEGKASGNGDITLSGASLWQLTDDSKAGSVSLNDTSTVSLSGKATKLETQHLGGSGGQFLMDLHYLGDDVNTYRDGTESDFIIAHDGSGSTYHVNMTDSSSVNGMKEGSKLYFASTAADSSAFAVNDSVQIQNYRKIYNKNLVVKKETDTGNESYEGYDDWFLTPEAIIGGNTKGDANGNTINPNGIVPGAAYNTAFALWRDDDTLLKRLGELRYNQEDQGIWARFINKHLERDGSHGFEGNYKTLQVGFDKVRKTVNNGTWYYGGAISHLWGSSTYTDGQGKQRSTDVAIYGTNVRPHGHYLDLVARFGRINSDYETTYSDYGKFKNWVSSISAEYGRKKVLHHGWAIEPQAQLTYSYLWGDDYTTKNGAKVQQDNADSLVGRLGFVLSREFDSQTKNPSRVYFKAAVLHDFLGDTQSRIMDDIIFTDQDDLGDTWYLLGIGTNIHFSDATQFYLDAERSFGSDVKMKYRFNAGLRFEF